MVGPCTGLILKRREGRACCGSIIQIRALVGATTRCVVRMSVCSFDLHSRWADAGGRLVLTGI